MFIGINGLGRIGKCILLQLIENKNINIKAINIPDFNINNIETYLKNDSNHNYNKNFTIEIISENIFKINNKKIHLLNNRDASQLNWKKYGINYVIDTTGVYLTYDKCIKHCVDYVIMCAPPKDNTLQFVYNVNNEKYSGEKIISNASCTTNCISPILKILDENYKIEKANFTTIHSMTASQNTTDTNNFKNRTSRAIMNNIIPHTTGASKSITKLLPNLEGKIKGTSLRVPVLNVSVVDLNVKLNKKRKLDELFNDLKEYDHIEINTKNLVSSDFNTTTNPTIIDKNACIDLGDGEFKLMIWYDNEWSYSSQVIKLCEHMVTYNEKNNPYYHPLFIENSSLENKKVILRVDWNIPYEKENFIINDDFRIVSSLKTIYYILKNNPKYLVIISHLGRPKTYDKNLSWKNFLEQLKKYFNQNICLLEDGISEKSLEILDKNLHKLYLCENIRFHDIETNYSKINNEEILNNETVKIFNNFGDVYINDAFGCMHRKHMSICGFNKEKYFGYLVDKEIKSLELINKNINNDKILAIIGGAKMDDKLLLLEELSKKVDGIYLSGGNINSIIKNDFYKNHINKIKENKSKIYEMTDGLASENLNSKANYYKSNDLPEEKYFFDIGMQSIIELNELIKEYDVIFWNGTLGVVENKLYCHGSQTLAEMLMKSGKKIIIGGGDTACFINNFDHNFFYVSTGGGASIDYISNGSLVGFDIFNKK